MISQMCKRKWRTFGTRSGVIARGMMHLVGGPTSKMALSQSAFTPWHVHRRRFKLLWQPLQVLTQVQQMRPRPSCRRRIGPGHRNRISVLQEFWLVVEKFQALYAQQSQKEAEEAIFGFVDAFFFWFCVAFFIVGTLRPWPSSRVVEEYLLPLPPHQLAMLHLQPKRLPWLLELRLDGGWWMMLDGGGGQVLLFWLISYASPSFHRTIN